MSGQTLAFMAGGTNNQNGIYTNTLWSTAVNRFADTNTPVPDGSGTFGSFQYIAVSGSSLAFSGSYGTFNPNSGYDQRGIYAGPIAGGSLTRIVDKTTPIPTSGALFTGFLYPSISGSTVAFSGSDNQGGFGIYAATIGSGTIITIVDKSTPIPSGSGTFLSFNYPLVNGSTIAFLGRGTGGNDGIYTTSVTGGAINKVVAVGDSLDGKTISALGFGKQGYDGSLYVFVATFTDGTSAVYTFNPVPEPTGLLPVSVAAAAGAFAVGRWLFRGF
jgi:hypothetical protein